MSEREVLKHKNGCDLYEVTIGWELVFADAMQRALPQLIERRRAEK